MKIASALLLLSVLFISVSPANAIQDFNTARGNREKGGARLTTVGTTSTESNSNTSTASQNVLKDIAWRTIPARLQQAPVEVKQSSTYIAPCWSFGCHNTSNTK
jgi:hypothetical protein